jgi:hypothetical protein
LAQSKLAAPAFGGRVDASKATKKRSEIMMRIAISQAIWFEPQRRSNWQTTSSRRHRYDYKPHDFLRLALGSNFDVILCQTAPRFYPMVAWSAKALLLLAWAIKWVNVWTGASPVGGERAAITVSNFDRLKNLVVYIKQIPQQSSTRLFRLYC